MEDNFGGVFVFGSMTLADSNLFDDDKAKHVESIKTAEALQDVEIVFLKDFEFRASKWPGV